MAKTSRKKADYFIGLDVSDDSIKVAALQEEGGEFTLLAASLFENPSRKVDPSGMQAISQFVSGLGIPPPLRFYSAVYGPHVLVRRLSLPKMPVEELQEAARWGAKEASPFSLEGAKVDSVVLGEIQERGAPKLDAMVMIASAEVTTAHLSLLATAGLALEGLVVPPVSVWSLAEHLPAPVLEEALVVIDLGEEVTYVHLFRGGKLEFSRELSLGGRALTESITGAVVPGQSLVVSMADAETIKKQFGIPSMDSQEVSDTGVYLRKVSEMMRPVLERLVNELRRSLDYFKEQFREVTMSRAYLVGGGALLKGIDGFLSRGLGVPVEILSVRDVVKMGPKLSEDAAVLDALPRFAPAIGLAMDHASRINFIRKPKPRFALPGLLKDRIKGIHLPTVDVKYMAAFFICLVLFILGMTARLYQVAGKLEKEVKEKQLILDDIRMLTERQAVLNKLRAEKPNVQGIFATLSRNLADPMIISELSFIRDTGEMKLSGLARSEPEIATFYQNLTGSALFQNVMLKELKKEGKQTKLPYSFQLQMMVKKS